MPVSFWVFAVALVLAAAMAFIFNGASQREDEGAKTAAAIVMTVCILVMILVIFFLMWQAWSPWEIGVSKR